MKIPWWIVAAFAVLAVLLGLRSRSRALSEARHRAEAGYKEALDRGDQATAAVLVGELARIDLELERERQRSVDKRLAEALADARARRGTTR